MKKLLTKLSCAAFLFCAISQNALASTASVPETVAYSFKAGAGRPGTIHPNGRQAHTLRYEVPVVTAEQIQDLDLESFLEVSHNNAVVHYVFAFKRPKGTMSSNTFSEHIQFAVMPEIGSNLRMGTAPSNLKTATDLINGFFEAQPFSEPLKEENVIMHLFISDERIEDSGAVLLNPGSKGARVSELSKGEAYARAGFPCLIPDIVGSEQKASIVDNQLQESMLANGTFVQICHRLLSGMKGVNREKIIWHGESIGTAQILAALMPEIIDIFEEAFVPPTFIALNDFATTLITTGYNDSPIWDIPTRISGGTKDNFTSLDQVYAFLKAHNPKGENDPLKVVVEHGQGHDSGTYAIDNMDQEEGAYNLENALNYNGLWASLTGSMSKIRAAVITLDDPSKLIPLMGPYMEEKLNLHPVGLEIMRQNLLDYRKNGVDDNIEGKIGYFVKGISSSVKGYIIDDVVPDGVYAFNPLQASDFLKCFPAGAFFGSESEEIAEDLIVKTMEHVLYHAGVGSKPFEYDDLDWDVLY